MQLQLVFVGLAPSLALAAGLQWSTLHRAVLAAIVVAAVEWIYNSAQLGMPDPASGCGLVLFLVLGGLSAWRGDDRIARLQPAVFALVGAALVLWSSVVLKRPVLVDVIDGPVGLIPALPAYQRGYAVVYATTLSRSLPWLLLMWSALLAWVTWRRSLAGWVALRSVGLYGAIVVLFVIERLLGLT